MTLQTEIALCSKSLSFFGFYGSSIPRLITSMILCVLFIILFCFQVIFTTFERTDVGFILMRGYLVLVGTVVAFMIVVSSMVTANKIESVLDNLAILGSGSEPKPLMRKMLLTLVLVLTTSFVMDITQQILTRANRNMVFINTVAIHISLLYNLLHIYQYNAFLYWLQAILRTVNEKVKKTCDRNGTGDDDGLKRKNVQEDFSLCYSGSSSDTLRRVKTCRKAYFDLFVLSEKINDVFGFRSLITVGHNFILGILFAYVVVSDIISIANSREVPDALELAVQIKWTILSFGSIYALVRPSRMTVMESSRTLEAVHRVLSNPIDIPIKLELFKFALQFLHEEISFTAHGFFKLNNKLLVSIIGAVVSYLVVLIQFRVSL